MLREPSLYWGPPVRSGLGGYTWNVVESFKGKWQHNGEMVYNATGAQVVSSGEVYTPMAVVKGGYLVEGVLPEGDPPPEAKQILLVDVIRSLSNSSVVYYKAYLE